MVAADAAAVALVTQAAGSQVAAAVGVTSAVDMAEAVDCSAD